MTLKIKKVRNIATLNITWVHSGSKMDLFKEIVLLEVYVSLFCVWGGGFWAPQYLQVPCCKLYDIYKEKFKLYITSINTQDSWMIKRTYFRRVLLGEDHWVDLLLGQFYQSKRLIVNKINLLCIVSHTGKEYNSTILLFFTIAF